MDVSDESGRVWAMRPPEKTTWGWWCRGLLVVAALAMIGLQPIPAGAQSAELVRVVEYLRAGAVNTQGTIDQAMASPALGDVTGDGIPDLVSGSMDGVLTVLDPRTGAVLRSVNVQSGSMLQASPTLIDVTGDGVLDVVVATVRNVAKVPGSSRVKIYDMAGGGARVVFDQGDSGLANLSGFFAAPVVGDIDGDGRAEVVAVGLDHRLHAWRLSGAVVPGFPVYTYDTSLSSPALADVDRDGAKEIVFGGDMDTSNQPLPGGGYLWVVDGRGDNLPGYPKHLGGEVIWSSPAVGDLDGDGDLDVVVGTGRNFGHADGDTLYALDLATAEPLTGWPRSLSGNTMSSPALADLDGDGRLDVVTATGDGQAHRRSHTGRALWATCMMPVDVGCDGDRIYIGSPVIVDIDADGVSEVVAAVDTELIVLDVVTGEIEQRHDIRSNPGDHAYPGANAPAVAAIGAATYVAAYVQVADGDGLRHHGDRQGLYVWESPASAPQDQWAQFRRDAARTGTIDPDAPAPDPQEPDETRLTGTVSYIDAVYLDLLGRPARARERYHWMGELDAGVPRGEFTLALSRSSEWTGGVIDELYQQIFGRPPDAEGRTYWASLVSEGLRVSDVASHFYGSTEWFQREPPTGGGGTVGGYVDNLYRRILRREPDAARSYWISELRDGAPRVRVAKAFYLSHESNVRRVDVLYRTLLDRRADEEGRVYWGTQLVTVDDIRLAGLLTASDEYVAANTR